MIGIIPVKEPVRLKHKHLLELGNKTILEIVYEKVSSIMDAVIYSKIDLPFKYVTDESENIVDLVKLLSRTHESFFLIGGDMPFFTVGDIKIMMNNFHGQTLVPVHEDHSIEPLFCIYSGVMKDGRNLTEMIRGSIHKEIPSSCFSRDAFFNVNTPEDYEKAKSMLSSMNH